MPRYYFIAEVLELEEGVIEAPNRKAALKRAEEIARETGMFVNYVSVDLIRKQEYDAFSDPM